MALTDTQLKDRLANREDSFVERKSSLSDASEIRRTVCAFANTVRSPMYGVLFVGVDNGGTPTCALDEKDHDESAKTLSDALDWLCPEVDYSVQWVELDGHQILAVVVPESRNSPHFAGPAYVRKGGKSPKVCDKMLDELVSDRLSKVRELRKWLEQPVSLAAVQQPNPMQRNIQPRKEIILTEVTPHWIAWKRTSDGSFHSIPLEEIKLQKDDRGSGRLLILIPHVDWVER